MGERETGFVYFVGSTPLAVVKIGWATNPWSRLHALQTGHPDKLRIHALARGSRTDEQSLHECFRPDKQHGEWFVVGPELRILMMLLGADLDFDGASARCNVDAVLGRFASLVERRFEQAHWLASARRASRSL